LAEWLGQNKRKNHQPLAASLGVTKPPLGVETIEVVSKLSIGFEIKEGEEAQP
jgi:hypothetical protein